MRGGWATEVRWMARRDRLHEHKTRQARPVLCSSRRRRRTNGSRAAHARVPDTADLATLFSLQLHMCGRPPTEATDLFLPPSPAARHWQHRVQSARARRRGLHFSVKGAVRTRGCLSTPFCSARPPNHCSPDPSAGPFAGERVRRRVASAKWQAAYSSGLRSTQQRGQREQRGTHAGPAEKAEAAATTQARRAVRRAAMFA